MLLRTLLLTAVVLAVASAHVAVHGAEPGDANEILGEWKIIKSVVRGKDSPDDVGLIFAFTKDKVKISDPKGHASDAGTWKYTVNPAKRPAEIEMQRDLEKRPDSGIYKLEKNTLTISMPEKLGGPRPKSFEGKDLVVFTLERVENKAK